MAASVAALRPSMRSLSLMLMRQPKSHEPDKVVIRRHLPAILDSRTLRSSCESGTQVGYDGAKRKRGSKLHLAVDTLGHLLALHVTPANADERGEVKHLVQALQSATGNSVNMAYVDQDYTASAPQTPPARRAWKLKLKLPNCRKPGKLSFFYPNAGWSKDRLPGRRASAV